MPTPSRTRTPRTTPPPPSTAPTARERGCVRRPVITVVIPPVFAFVTAAVVNGGDGGRGNYRGGGTGGGRSSPVPAFVPAIANDGVPPPNGGGKGRAIAIATANIATTTTATATIATTTLLPRSILRPLASPPPPPPMVVPPMPTTSAVAWLHSLPARLSVSKLSTPTAQSLVILLIVVIDGNVHVNEARLGAMIAARRARTRPVGARSLSNSGSIPQGLILVSSPATIAPSAPVIVFGTSYF
jgi:hypothetical protein